VEGMGRSGQGSGRAGDVRRRVVIVPHTHWDREWYEPFQTFRMRLVRMVDGLLDLLERDPSYRSFLLDGQLAVVDDYLEIRPHNEQRLRDLATAGRLTVGPWFILMDEFLVSGETIVRDLQAGLRRGAAFGGAMEVGYLPDMFGHIAQMPQILTQAGLTHAVVWRGVPSAIASSAFAWVAPDGSRVRAEYLLGGYGNGEGIADDAGALLGRLRAHLDRYDGFLSPDAPVLFMNGTDHQSPQPWLGEVVAEANQMQDELELEVSSLPDYLAGAPSDGLVPWAGELRSGARANLLMGVASNRVDVKRATAAAERVLERQAEPLSALFVAPDQWPAAFLDVAWARVIHNAAHDSVCACSADEVVDVVLSRYDEAREIGEGLVGEALGALSRSMADPGPVAVNPVARTRSGLVEVVVPATDDLGPDVQLLGPTSGDRAGLAASMTLDPEAVRVMVEGLESARVGDHAYLSDVTVTEDGAAMAIHIALAAEERPELPVEAIRRDLLARLAARPRDQVTITVDQLPARRVLARTGPVPGFGWTSAVPSALVHPVGTSVDVAGGAAMTNGLVTVSVDATDGTFALDGQAGFGRLVDGGDHGDTYNYSPPIADRTVDRPDSVTVAVVESGPVRAVVVVQSLYEWPERIDDRTGARVGSAAVRVTTRLELHADDPVLRVTTTFDNAVRDHRLRVHLPLPEPATCSRAECAFTVVTRGLIAEGRPDEQGIPTFPARRFVSAGGLTVVHDGLLEYELVDVAPVSPSGGGPPRPAAYALALTVVRATGMLSRTGMATRPLPAGPLLPLDGAQCIGPVRTRYALRMGEVDPYAMADDVLVALRTVDAPGGGRRPGAGSELTVRGAEVSALRRYEGGLEVRVFNPTDAATQVDIEGRTGWLVDLRGRPVVPFEGRFELRAQGIATLRLA
jgi:mannosylglycerate hydrolase